MLVLVAKNPDFDQVAAGLGLYLALNGRKEVAINCPTPMTVDFNRLVGVNKIDAELGNKNLLITFADYKAENIERVSYDIEDGQFKLTVIPKAEVVAPQKNQVKVSYSGLSSDLVVMVGGANESHFPVLNEKGLEGASFVHVGLNKINYKNKKVTSFVYPASSVSEIMAALVHDTGLGFNADIATNLLMGIEDGSNNFVGSGVTADTFAFVSELMRVGGQRTGNQGKLDKNGYPPGAIPGEMPKDEKPADNEVQQSVVSDYGQKLNMGLSTPVSSESGLIQPTGTATQLAQSTSNESDNEGDMEDPPKDWLQPPRIYKGDSINKN